MLTHLPLDDRLNRLFYLDGALCRLVYDRERKRFIMRTEAERIALDFVVPLIASGVVLWSPPDRFEPLVDCSGDEAVGNERDLLDAFLRSPAGRRVTDGVTRSRLETRLGDATAWLVRRALASDVTDTLDDDADPRLS